MNIFREFKDILGLESAAQPVRSLQEFFTLAGEIRAKLGSKVYLLDRYLSYLLGAATEVMCEEAATNGFSAGREVHMVCHDVPDGGHEQANHALHAAAKAYLDTHPLLFQEPITRSDILVVTMMDEYMRMSLARYTTCAGYKLMAVADMTHVEQLFEDISGIIGDVAPVERLNLLFRERFLAVPAMSAFEQGLTHDPLYCLNHCDPETSRQVFQLTLDHGYPIAAGGGDHA